MERTGGMKGSREGSNGGGGGGGAIELMEEAERGRGCVGSGF